jgi:hypothetical protein
MSNDNSPADDQDKVDDSLVRPLSLPPVFDPLKCDVEPVDPIPEEPWFPDTTIPEAPDDIDDCANTPVPQPELETPCPEITVEGDPRGGAVYTKVVPYGEGKAELRIEKGDCCDYDLQLDLDFPCVQLRSTDGPLPEDGLIPATVTVGAVPSATLIARNSDDCVYELGLDIVFPVGGGGGVPGATGATGPTGPPAPEIELEEGCGISIDEELKISVNPADLATAGTFEWVNMNCPEEVLAICSPGGNSGGVAILQGLLRYEDGAGPEDCPQFFSEVNLPYHCSLTITVDGYFSLNYQIFKKGLKTIEPEVEECPGVGLCVDDGSSPVAANQLTGSGLTGVSGGTNAIVYGQLFFEGSEENCGRLITQSLLPVGCHFSVSGGQLELDLAALAGDGLSVDSSGSCPKLKADSADFTGGCGIEIDLAKVISVNLADIAQAGTYSWSSTDCETPYLMVGCSTGSGLAATVGVIQTQGLVYYDSSGECPQLFSVSHLAYNCTLVESDGNLGIDLSLFGKGLTVSSDGINCPSVDICAEDGTLPIPFSDMTGTDLTNISDTQKAIVYGQVQYDPTPYPEPEPSEDPPEDPPEEPPNEPCKLFTRSYLPVGCHFNVTTGKLDLDLSALAGAGLSITSDDCPKLQVDLQTLLCAVPTEIPTTGDFVLGLKYTGETCQVVKFPITECPTGGDENGGGGNGGEPPPPPGP